MCIIIDANVAGEVFAAPPRDKYRPIFDWIENKDGRLVFGGKNAQELEKVESAKRRIYIWAQAGKAQRYDDDNLRSAQNKLPETIKSDDAHVLALALASRARILCTEDANLMDDFGDPNILAKPRGKIYRNASHKTLLKHHDGCKPKTSR